MPLKLRIEKIWKRDGYCTVSSACTLSNRMVSCSAMVQSGEVEFLSTISAWTARMAAVLIALTVVASYATDAFAYDPYANDMALGEQHEINYPAHDAFLIVQDALRGDGILFEVQNANTLFTYWKDVDANVSFFASLMGRIPRYRYEIEVIPDGSHRSRIIANVRGENMDESQLATYKASNHIHLFEDVDKLAKTYSLPSETPAAGGVNFVLLPNEDLKGLAKRATGNADNWQQIAKDNGIQSPSDVTPFQTIWVRNSLLARQATGPQAPAGH
jgi:hypothetical protein